MFSLYDRISASQRLSVPLSYRWLKLKVRLFGLRVLKEVIA